MSLSNIVVIVIGLILAIVGLLLMLAGVGVEALGVAGVGSRVLDILLGLAFLAIGVFIVRGGQITL